MHGISDPKRLKNAQGLWHLSLWGKPLRSWVHKIDTSLLAAAKVCESRGYQWSIRPWTYKCECRQWISAENMLQGIYFFFGSGPNAVSESTASNTELSECFGPHRVLGREFREFLSSYYLCAKANSPSLFTELTGFAASVPSSETVLSKQCGMLFRPFSSFRFKPLT